MLWPVSIEGFDGEIDGVLRAGFTVIMFDSTLFTVDGVESVISTFACKVLPASAEGITHAKLFEVPVIPEKSIFATSVPVIVFVIR